MRESNGQLHLSRACLLTVENQWKSSTVKCKSMCFHRRWKMKLELSTRSSWHLACLHRCRDKANKAHSDQWSCLLWKWTPCYFWHTDKIDAERSDLFERLLCSVQTASIMIHVCSPVILILKNYLPFIHIREVLMTPDWGNKHRQYAVIWPTSGERKSPACSFPKT